VVAKAAAAASVAMVAMVAAAAPAVVGLRCDRSSSLRPRRCRRRWWGASPPYPPGTRDASVLKNVGVYKGAQPPYLLIVSSKKRNVLPDSIFAVQLIPAVVGSSLSVSNPDAN
jgi:hypothetical protein